MARRLDTRERHSEQKTEETEKKRVTPVLCYLLLSFSSLVAARPRWALRSPSCSLHANGLVGILPIWKNSDRIDHSLSLEELTMFRSRIPNPLRRCVVAFLGIVSIAAAGYVLAAGPTAKPGSIRVKHCGLDDPFLNAGLAEAMTLEIESPCDHTVYIAFVATDAAGNFVESISGGRCYRPTRGAPGRCSVAIVKHDLSKLVSPDQPGVAWDSTATVVIDQPVTVRGVVSGWEPREISRDICTGDRTSPVSSPEVGKTYPVWEATGRRQRDLPDGRIDSDAPVVVRYSLLVKFVESKGAGPNGTWSKFDYREINQL